MDGGELEFSSQEVLSEIPECSSMNKRFNEILTDVHACIHAHTCNPPGPDNSHTHTHTCYHVHTKVAPPPCEDTNAESAAANIGKKRLLSNKEAVHKYCEKKKAWVASLEDEVVRLRAMNQQLLYRLQGRAVLEAEISRLKCLLVDIRARMDGEFETLQCSSSQRLKDVPGCALGCGSSTARASRWNKRKRTGGKRCSNGKPVNC